jgi:hypothetical protein
LHKIATKDYVKLPATDRKSLALFILPPNNTYCLCWKDEFNSKTKINHFILLALIWTSFSSVLPSSPSLSNEKATSVAAAGKLDPSPLFFLYQTLQPDQSPQW